MWLVSSGVPATDLVPFAGNGTLNALSTAVNAVGNGWSAQVAGSFGLWPAADLRGPQGALNACGQSAALQMHITARRAAVEAAVGLALVIALYRKKQSVSLDAACELKG